jgi:hypothetical protein
MRTVAYRVAACGLLTAVVVGFAGCTGAPDVSGSSAAPTTGGTSSSTVVTTDLPTSEAPADAGQSVACCGPISYSSEHTVAGAMGEPVPVTWSTGTGVVTVHQVRWDVFPLGDDTGMLMMIEATFTATTGTVNYGRMSWIETDSAGRTDGVQTPLLAGRDVHELPDAATLQPGRTDTGWAAFLLVDPPTAPIEIALIEFETTTKLVSWTTDGPPQDLIDVATSTQPFTPRSERIYQCPDPGLTLDGATYDAPAGFQGSPSPEEAAQRFAQAGIIGGIPTNTPWQRGPTDATGVFVTIEGVQMHAVQSPVNDTWIIDEVQYCRS